MSARQDRRRLRHPSALLFGAVLLGLLLGAAAPVAALDARLSVATVTVGQPVELTLIGTGDFPASIDLSPLEADFGIIDQRRAASASTINGRRQERQELILTLLPRRTGTLTIPPLVSGTETSAELPLRVTAATSPNARLLAAPSASAPPTPATPPMAVDVNASVQPESGVVGQERVLIVRASSPDGPPQGRLPPPKVAATSILPLGEQRYADDNDRFVFEQRFSLFPASPGDLEIADIGFDAWQPAGGAPVRHRAQPLRIQVTQPAALGDADTWLPARSLSLMEAGPTEVRIAPGQSIQRLVTLRADGLMAEQLPAIPLGIPFQLRVRDDPPRLWNERTPDGVVGYRTERILISADEAGSFILPAVSIDWWDTAAGQMRSATLAAWTVVVAPFASEDRRPAALWEQDRIKPPPLSAAAESAEKAEPLEAEGPTSAGGWLTMPIGAVLIAAGSLALGLLVLRARRRQRRTHRVTLPSTPEPAVVPDDAESAPAAAAIERIRRAYADVDAGAARDALLAWASGIWPARAPGNLSQLALRLKPPLRDNLKLLDKAFYGPNDGAWAQQPVADQLAALSDEPIQPQNSDATPRA